MNDQKKQEIKECLAELSMIVDSYNPAKEYYLAATGFSLIAICLIVIKTVGLLLGIVLICAGGIPIIYKLMDSKCSPSEAQLAERACILMSSCVNRYKYPEEKTYILIYNCYGNNLSLYNEFVSLFPNMESSKLRKLASIKLQN